MQNFISFIMLNFLSLNVIKLFNMYDIIKLQLYPRINDIVGFVIKSEKIKENNTPLNVFIIPTNINLINLGVR